MSADGLDSFVVQARPHGITDRGLIAVVLAGAVSAHLDGLPLWLLLIGSPSAGKSTTLSLLDKVVSERVGYLTSAGLLSSGTDNKGNHCQVGLLERIGKRGLVTISDMSNLLAMSDRGARDDVYALLRDAYDGSVNRSLGNEWKSLHWRGRLTVVAAATPAIDNFASHSNALGARWLHYRTDDKKLNAKLKGLKEARDRSRQRLKLDGIREEATKIGNAASQLVHSVEVSEELTDALDEAATVTCYGRASIERDAYGRREMRGQPVTEEPFRLRHQLDVLTRSCLALGITDDEALALARKCARDSMPGVRRDTLAAVLEGDEPSTNRVGQRIGTHWSVANRALEELEVVGVIASTRSSWPTDDPDTGKTPKHWSLTPDFEPLVRRIYAGQASREEGERTPQPPNAGDNPPESRNASREAPPAQTRHPDAPDVESFRGSSAAARHPHGGPQPRGGRGWIASAPLPTKPSAP